jgi:hypothetical protein
MPRQMPPLASKFADRAKAASGIAEAGEVIRSGARRGSTIYRELRLSRLEALHEMAYLRIFVAWEVFLEATFLRTQCGYESPLYSPVFVVGRSREPTLSAAQIALYGSQQYLLWHNPNSTVARARLWFDRCPLEHVILSNLSRLEGFAAVRHVIAHGSADARQKFDAAAIGLAGRRYPGSSAGRFLRDWDHTAVPRRRWLNSIADELSGLAGQIAP